jgi:hypothetical protein
MKRWMLTGVVMLVLGLLVMLALPAISAADTNSCIVNAAGEIVCQDGAGGGSAATCTADPDGGDGLPGCGTPQDNECFSGGRLAGKCDSEWHWKGGWWLARYYYFGLSRADFPLEFASLLPPEVIEATGALALPGGCFDHPLYNDLMFVGPPDTLNNTVDMNSADGTCINGVLSTYTSVFASSAVQAAAICATLGAPANGVDEYVAAGYSTSNTGGVMPAGLYWCIP